MRVSWGQRAKLSFQTELCLSREVFASLPFLSISVFTWCLRPDSSTNSFHWGASEIFKRRKGGKVEKKKENKEKKEKKKRQTRHSCERDHVCWGADPSWKMVLWKKPMVPNSWAAASLLWLLLYHFPSDEADQDKSAFLPLCLGPAPSLCQLLVYWGSWVWENPPGSSMYICSGACADGVSSGNHGSRNTTNKSNLLASRDEQWSPPLLPSTVYGGHISLVPQSQDSGQLLQILPEGLYIK